MPPVSTRLGLGDQRTARAATAATDRVRERTAGLVRSERAGCSNVTVDRCQFYFPDVGAANLFAAGIYATGTTAGVTVADCSFINTPEPVDTPFSDMRLGTVCTGPRLTRSASATYRCRPSRRPPRRRPPRRPPVPTIAISSERAKTCRAPSRLSGRRRPRRPPRSHPSVTERLADSAAEITADRSATSSESPITEARASTTESGVARALNRITHAFRSSPPGPTAAPVRPAVTDEIAGGAKAASGN